MKTLILLLMSCTVLFSLTGKEITITEGLWYISFPENSGEIKASEMAYRFNPDGSAEMVLSERAVKLREKITYLLTETIPHIMNLQSSFTYDNFGRRTSRTLQQDNTTVSTAERSYNTFGRIASVSNGTDTLSYTYRP